MTHCYNVCIFILFVSRTPISLLAGSFLRIHFPCPFDKSFYLSFLRIHFPCPFDKSFYLSFLRIDFPCLFDKSFSLSFWEVLLLDPYNSLFFCVTYKSVYNE